MNESALRLSAASKNALILIDESLDNNINLAKTLRGNRWKLIRVSTKCSNKKLNKIIEVARYEEIHIISHAIEDILCIGRQIKVDECINAWGNRPSENKGSITLWGCKAQNHISAINKNDHAIKASKKDVGDGETILGYGELTEAIRNIPFTLNQKQNTWTSTHGELSASNRPRKANNQWVLRNEQNPILIQGFRIGGGGTKFQNNTKLSGTLTSNTPTFDNWAYELDGSSNKYRFKTPNNINNGSSSKKSQYKAIINVSEGKYNGWELNGAQDLVNFKGIKVDGKLSLKYDVPTKIYELGGEIDVLGNNMLKKYFNFDKNTLRGSVQVKNTNNNKRNKRQSNWTIEGFNGRSSFDIKNIFGLGGLKGENTRISYTKTNQKETRRNNRNKSSMNGDYKINNGIQTTGKQGILSKGIKIPSLKFNLNNRRLSPGDWKLNGKLSPNLKIPGLSLDSKIKIESKATDENTNKINLGGIKLKKSQEFINRGGLIKDLELERNKNNKWSVQSWDAQGSLSKAISGLKLKPNIGISFKRENGNERFNVKNAGIAAGKDQIMGEESIVENLELRKNNGQWRINRLNAQGSISNLIKPLGVKLSPKISLDYNYDRNLKQGIYTLSGALNNTKTNDQSSLLKNGEIKDLKFQKGKNGWEITQWSARGDLNIQPIGLSVEIPTINFKDSEYSIEDIEISQGDESETFMGQGRIEKMTFESSSAGKEWWVNNLTGEGEINFGVAGIPIKGETKFEYVRDPSNSLNSRYKITDGKINIGDNKNKKNSYLLTSGHLNQLEIGYGAPKSTNQLEIFNWHADGKLEMDLPGIKLEGNTEIRYKNENKLEQYEIKKFNFKAQGDVDKNLFGEGSIDNLKINKDLNNQWETEEYSAEGNINLDVRGIELNADLKMDYKSDDKGGLYTIEEGNIGIQRNDNKLFNKGTVRNLRFRPTNSDQETKQNWEILQYQINGDFALDMPGIDLEGRLNMSYDKDRLDNQIDQNDLTETQSGTTRESRSSYFVKQASLEGKSKSSLFKIGAKAEITDLNFDWNENLGSNGNWDIDRYNAEGALGIDVNGISFESKGELNFNKKGVDSNGRAAKYHATAELGGTEDNNLFANGKIKDLYFNQDKNEWQINSYLAEGKLLLDVYGINFAADIKLSYDKDAKHQKQESGKETAKRQRTDSKLQFQNTNNIDPNVADSRYWIQTAKLSAGDENSLFSGNAKLKNLYFDHREGQWNIDQYHASGNLDINVNGINFGAKAKLIYNKKQKDHWGREARYLVENVSLGGETTDQALFGEGRISNLYFDKGEDKDETSQGDGYAINSYLAEGQILLDVYGVNFDAAVKLSYDKDGEHQVQESTTEAESRKDIDSEHQQQQAADITPNKNNSRYWVKTAKLCVADKNSLFSGQAELNNLYFDYRDDQWDIDQYQASGKLDINVKGINFKAETDLIYNKKQKDHRGRRARYFVKNVSLGAATPDQSLFGEGRISNLYFDKGEDKDGSSQNSAYTINSYLAEGKILLDVYGINFDTAIKLSYDKDGDHQDHESTTEAESRKDIDSERQQQQAADITPNKNDSRYWIQTAQLNAGGEKNLFSGKATLNDLYFDRTENSWEIQQYDATGKLGIGVNGLNFGSDVEIKYRNNRGEKSWEAAGSLSAEGNETLMGNGKFEDLILRESGEEKGWEIESWKAQGALMIDTNGINIDGRLNVEYSSKDKIYKANGEVNTQAGDIFKGNINIKDMIIEEKNTGKDRVWETQSWKAKGKLGLQVFGLDLSSGELNVDYKKENGEDIYTVKGTVKGDGDIFRGEVDLKTMEIHKIKNEGWQAKSWEASGLAEVNASGMDINGKVDMSYDYDKNEENNVYTIEEGELSIDGESDLFKANSKIQVKDLKMISPSKKTAANEKSSQDSVTPISGQFGGNVDIDSNEFSLQGNMLTNYSYDPSTKESTWKTLEDEDSSTNKVKFDLCINGFESQLETKVSFKRTSQQGQAYYPYMTASVNSGELKVGDLFEFKIPEDNGVEFGYLQNKVNDEIETLYAINGDLRFDLVKDMFGVEIAAGKGSMIQSVGNFYKEDNNNMFDILRESEVKNGEWNVGSIEGAAEFKGKAEIDLGLATIGKIAVNGSADFSNLNDENDLDGEITIPFGLFSYRGNERDEEKKKGINSKIKVAAKDVDINLDPITQPLKKVAEGFSTFTTPLQGPINALTNPAFIGDPAQWIENQGKWARNQAVAAVKPLNDIGLSINIPQVNWKNSITSEIGPSAADLIDQIHKLYRQTPKGKNSTALNLSNKLNKIKSFIGVINDIKNFSPSSPSMPVLDSEKSSLFSYTLHSDQKKAEQEQKREEKEDKDKSRESSQSSGDVKSEWGFPTLGSYKDLFNINNSTKKKSKGSDGGDHDGSPDQDSGQEDPKPSKDEIERKKEIRNSNYVLFPQFMDKVSFGNFLKDMFMAPKDSLPLISMNLGTGIKGEFSTPKVPTGIGLSASGSVDIGAKTRLETQVNGEDLFKIITGDKGMDDFALELIKENTFWMIGKDDTSAHVEVNLTPSFDLNLLSLDSVRNICPSRKDCGYNPICHLYNLGVDSCTGLMTLFKHDLGASVEMSADGLIKATVNDNYKIYDEKIPVFEIPKAITNGDLGIDFGGDFTVTPRANLEYIVGKKPISMDPISLYSF